MESSSSGDWLPWERAPVVLMSGLGWWDPVEGCNCSMGPLIRSEVGSAGSAIVLGTIVKGFGCSTLTFGVGIRGGFGLAFQDLSTCFAASSSVDAIFLKLQHR
jgi:hypothetical protein